MIRNVKLSRFRAFHAHAQWKQEFAIMAAFRFSNFTALKTYGNFFLNYRTKRAFQLSHLEMFSFDLCALYTRNLRSTSHVRTYITRLESILSDANTKPKLNIKSRLSCFHRPITPRLEYNNVPCVLGVVGPCSFDGTNSELYADSI